MTQPGLPSDSLARIKRLVDIAWRRRWWLVLATVLSVTTSLALVLMLPKVYRASTTVLVSRQSLPESIVRSTVTMKIEDRMRNLQTQLFSLSYLEPIVREFGLVPADATESEVEAACGALRTRIVPTLDTRNLSWFQISVDDVDRKRAAAIANRLADLFIEQNSRMRAAQASGTLEATQGWEEKYRLELSERDRQIAAFHRENGYASPEQQQVDLQLLSGAQATVSRLTSEIRARGDRLVVLRAQRQAETAGGATTADSEAPLSKLQHELTALLVSYTEENPLVKRTRERIAALAAAPGPPGLDPIAERIAGVEGEIRGLERDRAREYANIATYGARIGEAPRRQQKLIELKRDYDQAKLQFDASVAQNEQARRSRDMEASGIGDQFQIQDRAFPPSVPYTPNVFLLLVVGIGLGLALGVGAIALRELLGQTVWGEDELAASFPDLPVYGVIPSLDSGRGARPRPSAALRHAGARAVSYVGVLLWAPFAALGAWTGRIL